jgi:hypothetical protein
MRDSGGRGFLSRLFSLGSSTRVGIRPIGPVRLAMRKKKGGVGNFYFLKRKAEKKKHKKKKTFFGATR